MKLTFTKAQLERKRKRSLKWHQQQYAVGAIRGIDVALKFAAMLDLDAATFYRFMPILVTTMKRMARKKDTDGPFIQRAINTALLSLQAGETPHDAD